MAGILLAKLKGFFWKREKKYMTASIKRGILEKDRDVKRGFPGSFAVSDTAEYPPGVGPPDHSSLFVHV